MGATEVIELLQSLGISIRATGDKLLLDPGSRVPPELVQEIRQNKQEIMALLALPSQTQHHDNPTAALLSWANQAAEEGLMLPEPVHFLETPLRPITLTAIGRYCREKLRVLAMAHSNQESGGWGKFSPEWWRQQEQEQFAALASLKASLDEQEGHV
jgi:hypothetical protein